MITSLQLNNFQSHENSKLDFTPGINVITGKSDSGKSSVLKALFYAVKNKPSSNNYPSHWVKDKNKLSGEMKITVLKNNMSVVRIRNKTDNGYLFNDQVLNAIGMGVPKEIQNHFNLHEVNIQQQFDTHFLLSETPGAIARFLNELVKLDDIDIYLSAVDSKKRETSREIKNKETVITDTEKELKNYDWLESAQILAEQYKNICQELEVIQNKFSILKNVSTDIQKSKTILKRYANVDKIIKHLENYQIIQSNYSIQCTQIENLKLLQNQIKAGIHFLNTRPDLQKIDLKINTYAETNEKLKNLEIDHHLLQTFITALCSYKAILEKATDIEKVEKLTSKIQIYEKKIKSYK